jgi:hypothetical protein
MTTRKKILKLRLTNTSKWPSWFVEFVIRWLMKRQEFPAHVGYLKVKIRDTSRVRHGRAWPGTGATSLACARRTPKSSLKDRYFKFSWEREIQLRSSVEMLIRILGHEMRHLDPDNTRGLRGQGIEHDAEYHSEMCVMAWREQWPTLRTQIRAAAREDKQRRQRQQQQTEQREGVLCVRRALRDAAKAKARADKNSPQCKLDRVLDQEKKLLTRLKRIQTSLKKINRRKAALKRSVAKQSAARSQSSVIS